MSARDLFRWKKMLNLFLEAGISEASVLSLEETTVFGKEVGSSMRRHRGMVIRPNDSKKSIWAFMEGFGEFFDLGDSSMLAVRGADRYMVMRYDPALIPRLERVYGDSQDVFSIYPSGLSFAVSFDLDKTAYDWEILCVTLYSGADSSLSEMDSMFSGLVKSVIEIDLGEIFEIG